MSPYLNKTHTFGRIWTVITLIVFIFIPLSISIHYNAWPAAGDFFKAFAMTAVIFYPTGIIEVISYAPFLGTAGTYLSFVTGNITNLKLPCTITALDSSGYKITDEEGEVIATIAVAVSSIVTTVIIAVCIIFMSFTGFIQTITSESSPLYPAFQNILPCLFGAIGASYFLKHWKLCAAPLIINLIILLFSGSAQVGVLIPVGVIAALIATHLMYKKGWLGEEPKSENSNEAD